MISQHTYDLAEELGIKIAPLKEKINIFDYNGNFICSIGVKKDYYFYLKTKGLSYAEYKRLQYWYKHRKEINKLGTVEYYTAILPWQLEKKILS